MSAWRIAAGIACVVVPVTFGRIAGVPWRRSVALYLEGAARAVLLGMPLVTLDALFGRTASLCLIPLVLVASWMGRSSLGILNFLFLQWFGVRLARGHREVQRALTLEELAPTWGYGPRYVTETRPCWSLLRWVWPLTGWWSGYRWIAKRGGAR